MAHEHYYPCLRSVRFWLFREPDTRNWKSSDTWSPVNNFVKTHKYSWMYKITNMNTRFSCFIGVIINVDFIIYINPNPLGIFTRKYPESTKIHQFCHTQNAGVLNPSESASVDIGHILNPPKSTTNFLVDFGRFRIPCSHENLYSMLLHRIHQNLTYTVHVTIIHQPTWPSS